MIPALHLRIFTLSITVLLFLLHLRVSKLEWRRCLLLVVHTNAPADNWITLLKCKCGLFLISPGTKGFMLASSRGRYYAAPRTVQLCRLYQELRCKCAVCLSHYKCNHKLSQKLRLPDYVSRMLFFYVVSDKQADGLLNGQ